MNTGIEKYSAPAHSLMERVLRGGEPIAPEYPTVFHSNAAGSFVTVEDRGEVRAACAILPRDLVVPGARIRVGMIGSVVTDPAHRQRGFGSRLIDSAVDALREQGCVAALLWADDRGFYARRGWREIGIERDFVVSADLAAEFPEPVGVRPYAPADAKAIHALYLRHERRVERDEDETSELLACPGMQVLVCERGAAVVAYACLGRGHDLPGVVHEWGGAADDVMRLVRAFGASRLAAGDDGDLFVMSPGAHVELHGRLALLGAPSSVGVLGMGRVVDAEVLARHAAELLGPDGIVRARRATSQARDATSAEARSATPAGARSATPAGARSATPAGARSATHDGARSPTHDDSRSPTPGGARSATRAGAPNAMSADARTATSGAASADRIEFTGPRGIATIASDDLLDVLFAARGERGAARDLGARLGVDAARLPLAPFVWGLDSI